MTATGPATILRLQSVYIPQGAKSALPPRELSRDYHDQLLRDAEGQSRAQLRRQLEERERDQRMQEYLVTRSTPILELVGSSRNERLVVLGDPGLGKSTLLQYLALEWAEGTSPKAAFPLLIELRQYVNEQMSERSFVRYLGVAPSAVWRFPVQELEQRLRSRPMLVMFDGLDEIIDGTARRTVVNEIVRFAREYPLARIIVTTRIVGYHPGSSHPETFRNAGFSQFTLQDFEPAEMEQFNQKWHRTAFPDQPQRAEFSKRLSDALDGSPAIRELAGNPLLLTFMALLNRTQPLPRTRRLLYEKTAELLLGRWEVPKFGGAEDKIGIEEKKRMLQAVAFEIQEQRTGIGVNQIGEERLREIFRAYLRDNLGLPDFAFVANELLQKLHARNHMLCFLGDKQFGFVHRTFLEYFAALALHDRIERTKQLPMEDLLSRVRQNWRQDVWHEVYRLLCSVLSADQSSRLITELLEQRDSEDGWRAVILAADCLDEIAERGLVRGLSEDLRAAVRKLTEYDLLYYYEPSDEDDRSSVERVRSSAYERWARIWRDTSTKAELLAHLQGRASGTRHLALRELARGWGDDAEVLPLLKDRARNDEDADVQSTALNKLARGWRDDTDVLPLLKDRARNDQNADVRSFAISVLAWGWRDNPEVLQWVEECERDEEDHSVRSAAVVGLARGWCENPNMLEWLKDRARDDEEEVRSTAVSELARGWRDDSEVLPLLKDRARNDVSCYVRSAAVAGLAQGWRNDPGVLQLLKDRALKDEHSEVQSTAVMALARGWYGDPEVLSLLKDQACTDGSYSVRRTAVSELALGWRSNPNAVALLKDRVLKDGNQYVRRAAVSELAKLARGLHDGLGVLQWLKDRARYDDNHDVRSTALSDLAHGWRDDAGMLPLLMDRARYDDNYDVRSTAVSELARGWRDDSDVLPLLKDRALNDEHNDVRSTAVSELARGWRDDSDVLPLLKDRALNDEHNDVRRTAVRELARAWRNGPDVLPLLKDRALNAEDEVRRVALSELARGWPDDVEVVQILKQSPLTPWPPPLITMKRISP
ncbi:MAG: HEAT repeat domain-containing protein [Bryobacteraceae bacterium]